MKISYKELADLKVPDELLAAFRVIEASGLSFTVVVIPEGRTDCVAVLGYTRENEVSAMKTVLEKVLATFPMPPIPPKPFKPNLPPTNPNN